MARGYLLLGALIAGCGRFGFDARAGGEDATEDAPVDATSFGPWSALQPLTALDSPADDSDPELRGDGLELIFHSNRTGDYDLYHSVRTGLTETFPAPTALASLTTTGNEIGPSLSADGRTLLYSDGQDIVFATRPTLADPFTGPTPLPALSSTDTDTAPEISGDGRVAMVTRGVVDTRDIWMYTRAADGPPGDGWSVGERVIELASPVTDCSPSLDEHGLTVYFHSDRVDGNTDDIYVATRATTTEPFGPPVLVVGISSPSDEGDPTLTADQRTIVFHRLLDLYLATR